MVPEKYSSSAGKVYFSAIFVNHLKSWNCEAISERCVVNHKTTVFPDFQFVYIILQYTNNIVTS